MNFTLRIIITLAAALAAMGANARITVEGTGAVSLTPDAASGLKALYVLQSAADARVVFTPDGAGAVSFQEFSNLGGGYARDITPERRGDSWVLTPTSPGIGYIITTGQQVIALWLCDYAASPYTITAIAAAEPDCQSVRLQLTGQAPALTYHGLNGRAFTIDREIAVTFDTLEFDEDSFTYIQRPASQTFASATDALYLPSPLCQTEYAVHPDRFATKWGLGTPATTAAVSPVAVEGHTAAVQATHDADNEQKTDSETLGGSAPCEVTFSGAVTDAAIYHRWEIAGSPDFEDTFLTFNELAFTHTFTEAGTLYVRMVADNSAGSCEWQSDTYTVSIGESRLECPNIFTPGVSEGVNDEWKVSYKSIVTFDCHIFNRWGQGVAHLTHPSQGWDGKMRGKVVPSGVYFYVIKARGSDGVDYNLSGDINIVSSRANTSLPAAE